MKMSLVLCKCGVYHLDPENATYVENGVPLCSEWTCAKVRMHKDGPRVPLAALEYPNETED